MKNYNTRRSFLQHLPLALPVFAGTTALGTVKRSAEGESSWLDQIDGRERMVFDSPAVHNGMQTIWSWVFLDSHNQKEVKDNDVSVVVVFRQMAAGLALEDRMWRKYKLGKYFDVLDPTSNAPAERNLYWNPADGEMPEAGMSIKKLQERGVIFCVCDRALTNTSTSIAKNKGVNGADIKAEFVSALLPQVHVVTSGVWAIQQAQQRGCAYCFAG